MNENSYFIIFSLDSDIKLYSDELAFITYDTKIPLYAGYYCFKSYVNGFSVDEAS